MDRPADDIAAFVDDPDEIDLLASLCVGRRWRFEYAAKCLRSVVTSP